MIAITLNSQSCWLLPYQPGDNTALSLGVSIPVDANRSLTGASSRRPEALAPRYTFDYRAVLLAADFFALRAASMVGQDEPILVPLWPHAYRPGIDTPTITAGLVVAYKADWSSYAINPGSYSGFDYVAPIIFGRFRQPPRLVAQCDGLITADITITEDAPVNYSFFPASGQLPADTTFTNASGVTAPVFPFAPDWSKTPEPGSAVVDSERTATGPGRQASTAYYPQIPEQIYTATFTGIGASDAAKVIAWWVRRCGTADAHWVATSQAGWHLAASASVGASSVTLTLDTPAPAVGAILALCGETEEIVRVASISGAVITLAAPLAKAWGITETRVAPAMLARHTNTELTVNYFPAGGISTFKLSWRETAAEYTTAAGEVRGVTLGRLPGSAWFFQIDLDYNGAISSTYLTNFESGATTAGHAWAYNPCDFDRLVQSIDLSDDSCTFKMRWFAGCPWENWKPGRLSARGFLTIFRADVDPAGTFSGFGTAWKGELSTPTPDGPNLSVKVIGANALFARKGPRQIMSTNCGTNLFKPRCGLALADWTFNASIVSVAGNIVTIGSITRANAQALPSGFGAVDWFALGWMGWTSTGMPMRECILTSAAIGSGQIVLTLDRASSLSAGASVTVAPGCDRQGSTCRNTFNNYANFRGFEQMPAVSPNFIIPQNQTNAAKK